MIDKVIELGTVTRSQLIESAATLDNSLSPVDFDGFIEIAFDASCDGGPDPWVMMPKQAIRVTAGQAVDIGSAGYCNGMAVGPRSVTLTAWDSDGITIVYQAVVNFTLTE